MSDERDCTLANDEYFCMPVATIGARADMFMRDLPVCKYRCRASEHGTQKIPRFVKTKTLVCSFHRRLAGWQVL